jgi:hypothetical protein
MKGVDDVAAVPRSIATRSAHPNVKVMPNDGELLDPFAEYCDDEALRMHILVENPMPLYGFAATLSQRKPLGGELRASVLCSSGMGPRQCLLFRSGRAAGVDLKGTVSIEAGMLGVGHAARKLREGPIRSRDHETRIVQLVPAPLVSQPLIEPPGGYVRHRVPLCVDARQQASDSEQLAFRGKSYDALWANGALKCLAALPTNYDAPSLRSGERRA